MRCHQTGSCHRPGQHASATVSCQLRPAHGHKNESCKQLRSGGPPHQLPHLPPLVSAISISHFLISGGRCLYIYIYFLGVARSRPAPRFRVKGRGIRFAHCSVGQRRGRKMRVASLRFTQDTISPKFPLHGRTTEYHHK